LVSLTLSGNPAPQSFNINSGSSVATSSASTSDSGSLTWCHVCPPTIAAASAPVVGPNTVVPCCVSPIASVGGTDATFATKLNSGA
jgi:hypothetical protein